ncbi:hypothetical protein [Pseudonocardia lacus]|uniref:hypothetical protein n=1 Tax=Pseudonocardia lacus TaxID=2835865 RepID=UPI001BDD5FFF|nr:hypothetical protein [Pseudonocardia lacus]
MRQAAAALAVAAALLGGCRADPPAPAADPLGDVESVLDAVERDLGTGGDG